MIDEGSRRQSTAYAIFIITSRDTNSSFVYVTQKRETVSELTSFRTLDDN